MEKADGTYDVRLINDWHFAADSASKLFILSRFSKIVKSNYYLRHGCPSVLWNIWAPTGRIFVKFDI